MKNLYIKESDSKMAINDDFNEFFRNSYGIINSSIIIDSDDFDHVYKFWFNDGTNLTVKGLTYYNHHITKNKLIKEIQKFVFSKRINKINKIKKGIG